MEHLKEKFRVVTILHSNTKEPRTDGRYPQRVGSIVEIPYGIREGISCGLFYTKDANGNDKTGCLTTSFVKDYYINDDCRLVIVTNKSIYELELIDEKKKIGLEN